MKVLNAKVPILFCLIAGSGVMLSRVIAQPTTKSQDKTLQVGSYKVIVTLGERSLQATEVDDWWGGFSPKRTNYVERIRVIRNNEAIAVPVSAYSGLSGVRSVSCRKGGAGAFFLVIHGADAGAGYEANITVRGDHVTERVVRHNEFPEEAWERTTYSSVPDDGR